MSESKNFSEKLINVKFQDVSKVRKTKLYLDPKRLSLLAKVRPWMSSRSFLHARFTSVPGEYQPARLPRKNLNTMGRSEFLSARQCKLANRTTSECKSRRQLNFSHTIGYFHCRDWRYCDCKHYRNRIISNSWISDAINETALE